ncbi:MAG: DNA polymerase III subunit alpha [Candidatus Marinimicrobia bacterium]|nr:DNA polymerase III subunit alpha [Candidatus Neomarinimicrobiota bacterium]
MADFVHLHNHSDFSLQDGAQSVQMLCDRVDDLGMDSIALTEHGNLFSMIPFYKAARKKGIKPILGCEVYVAVCNHKEKKRITTSTGKKWGYHHLVLLVQNEIGYKNLMKLVSIGYLDGFYYRPRIDKDLLRQFNEGLIATSACLAGEVTQHAAKGDYENAKKAALEYAEIFPGRFYLELQNHQITDEQAAHVILKKLSEDLNLPLVATNDCHYAMEDHWEAHDVLFCLGTDKNRDDPNRVRYEPRQFYIKSTDEMYALFRDVPQALENTLAIAESCDLEIPMGDYHLPTFPIPLQADTEDADAYLRLLCEKGIAERYGSSTDEIRQRLDFELNVIQKMGFAGYFLITQDFVKYARDKSIPVGPGRGSAAGSLVAYSTGITDVDPIKYNLLFERFLNPDRISMPDIDIDFCIEGREKVITYIKERYGYDSVAQIITFGTMKSKSVLRDVGRVLGLSYGEVDRIAKMVPADAKMTLQKAEKMNPELAKVISIDETHRDLMDFSKVLEGLHRHASTHAAGVVITPGPLMDYVPLFKSPSTGDISTQVEMKSLEDLGLLKMDFLGLRNLTVINKAVLMIEKNRGDKIDIAKIDLEDEAVFTLFSKGRTTGIFQFESDGMREYLKQLKPSCIGDLIAMNALYRPGPMANIPEFIARKTGKSKIDYIHPELEPVLKETYGIIVYQEQVMQISQIIGGFTLAQGDMLRRAMGKKLKETMAAFKVDFVAGARKKNINEKRAVKIFDLLEKFAEYGFNKSHSTAYAIVAYQTAWLKSHYPAEYMAANLSSEMDDTDKVVKLIGSVKKMGMEIMFPDVNTSAAEFVAVNESRIAYGMAAIKNQGSKASVAIAQYREKKGVFKTLHDLCSIDSHVINRKSLEALVQAGACDSLVGHRAQQFAAIDEALRWGQKFNEEALSSQESLFGGDSALSAVAAPVLPDVEEWSVEECLKREKDSIGFYLSGNPLEKYESDLDEFANVSLANIPDKKPEEIRIGGIIRKVNTRYDKNNRPWAIVELNGSAGKADIFVFNDVFEKTKSLLTDDNLVFIKGSPSNRDDDPEKLKMIAGDVFPLSETRSRLSRYVNIRLDNSYTDADIISQIKLLSSAHKGRCGFMLHLQAESGAVQKIRASKTGVSPAPDFIFKLRNLVGERNVWIS